MISEIRGKIEEKNNIQSDTLKKLGYSSLEAASSAL